MAWLEEAKKLCEVANKLTEEYQTCRDTNCVFGNHAVGGMQVTGACECFRNLKFIQRDAIQRIARNHRTALPKALSLLERALPLLVTLDLLYNVLTDEAEVELQQLIKKINGDE